MADIDKPIEHEIEFQDHKAPDLLAFARSLELHQVIMLRRAIEYGPTVIEELYTHLADINNAAQGPTRTAAAERAEKQFFTEEAYDRYEQAQRELEKQTGGRILLPGGGPNNPFTS